MYTSIQKWGNSNAVRIPKAILNQAQLSENDKVEILVDEASIIIKKRENKYSNLDELFADYDGDYKCAEYDWGKDLGNEIV